MTARCEDPDDKNSYGEVVQHMEPSMSTDWRNLIHQWQLSMDVNGGTYNNNASNGRILTQLILQEPELNPLLPSTAEALAVYASSALVVGSVWSTFRHYWGYDPSLLDPGEYETFPASVRSQEFQCMYQEEWQRLFYVVLILVFFMNIICVLYLIFCNGGILTDFAEPQNLFALAINSPPCAVMNGACGGGPTMTQINSGWCISHDEGSHHYFFEGTAVATGVKAKQDEIESGLGKRFVRLRGARVTNLV